MKTVLVVEDERSLTRAITMRLEKSGFKVVSAVSVDEAWEALNANDDIQAVWLDHYLTGNKTGFDLLVMMREDERYEDLPVFVVSNTEGSQKLYAYTKLEIEKYFTKAKNQLGSIIDDIKEALVE